MNDKVTRPLTAIEAHDYEGNAGTALPGHAGTALPGHARDTPNNYLTNPSRKPTTLRDITGNVDNMDFFNPHVTSSSTKWRFSLQSIAAPGQTVWLLEDNHIVTKVVGCIRIHIVKSINLACGIEHKVQYSLPNSHGDQEWVTEDSVFASKADLLASL